MPELYKGLFGSSITVVWNIKSVVFHADSEVHVQTRIVMTHVSSKVIRMAACVLNMVLVHELDVGSESLCY